LALKQQITRLGASLEYTEGDRARLGGDIARIHGERAQEETKRKLSEDEQRKEVTGLRKSLKAAEELARSTTEELTKCKNGAMESSRYIQDSLNEAQVLRDDLDEETQLDAETRCATVAHQKLEVLTDRFRQIGMYNRARSQVLQFLYHSLGLKPDDIFTEDPPSLILETTKRHLKICKITKYQIDKVHKAASDKYKEVCARLESAQEYFEITHKQLEDARSEILEQDYQISELKKYATVQMSAHQVALQERNQLALALRDTKSQYNQLVQFLETISLRQVL
jgi:hypothetical protein